MAMKTQGTKLYLIDPADHSLLAIPCAISISGISAQRDQLETTCLEDPARTYEAGLATPGQASFTLHFDPKEDAHKRVYELWVSGDKFELALGYSDGTAPPTVDTDHLFNLPTTRSWIVMHDAYFADVPQELALNALVTANVSVQLSGFPVITAKT